MAKTNRHDRILLAHGGGGQLTDELIRHHILPRLRNDALAELGDSARLNVGAESVFFTTDSYVVKPLFFNGGDVGKLAVCGTVNDLAVAGSRPVALALSLIIEEGFEFEQLERILASISQATKENNVDVVTIQHLFVVVSPIASKIARDLLRLLFLYIAYADQLCSFSICGYFGTIGAHSQTYNTKSDFFGHDRFPFYVLSKFQERR